LLNTKREYDPKMYENSGEEIQPLKALWQTFLQTVFGSQLHDIKYYIRKIFYIVLF
jgi:hypothetical protein